ncbi:MAG: hypothetical protein EXR28_14415 [Betaproteobacteria bacterium]|nr:hypothetical protein [Betaproteobacteria bacterium]
MVRKRFSAGSLEPSTTWMRIRGTRELRAHAAAGVGQMITTFPIEVEVRAMLRRSLRLFQEQVMPHVAA